MVPWLGLFADGFLISGGWWLAGHGLRQTRTPGSHPGDGRHRIGLVRARAGGAGDLRTAGDRPGLDLVGGYCALGLGALSALACPTSPQGSPRSPWRWDVLIALGLVFWTVGRAGNALALASGQGRQRRADLPSLLRGPVVEGRAVVPGGGSVRRERRDLLPRQRRPLVHLADGDVGGRPAGQGRPGPVPDPGRGCGLRDCPEARAQAGTRRSSRPAGSSPRPRS